MAPFKRDELTIAYQPLMSRCGTRMQGLEALVRWHHPDLGVVPPEDFIPLAESRGLVIPLGEWVLRRACQDARRWPGLRIAVNVSPVQFRHRGFVDGVKAILDSTGFDPNRLDLELTEGVLIQDAEQAEAVIMDLRALGIRMGLDDFGSGYSSMIYLRRFAFDKIKIDRAFLESMEANGEGAIILESIVSLGHALGLTVTAEGVEYPEQVAFLQNLGCDEMQGLLLRAPPPRARDRRASFPSGMDARGDSPGDPRPQRRLKHRLLPKAVTRVFGLMLQLIVSQRLFFRKPLRTFRADALISGASPDPARPASRAYRRRPARRDHRRHIRRCDGEDPVGRSAHRYRP